METTDQKLDKIVSLLEKIVDYEYASLMLVMGKQDEVNEFFNNKLDRGKK